MTANTQLLSKQAFRSNIWSGKATFILYSFKFYFYSLAQNCIVQIVIKDEGMRQIKKREREKLHADRQLRISLDLEKQI